MKNGFYFCNSWMLYNLVRLGPANWFNCLVKLCICAVRIIESKRLGSVGSLNNVLTSSSGNGACPFSARIAFSCLCNEIKVNLQSSFVVVILNLPAWWAMLESWLVHEPRFVASIGSCSILVVGHHCNPRDIRDFSAWRDRAQDRERQSWGTRPWPFQYRLVSRWRWREYGEH